MNDDGSFACLRQHHLVAKKRDAVLAWRVIVRSSQTDFTPRNTLGCFAILANSSKCCW